MKYLKGEKLIKTLENINVYVDPNCKVKAGTIPKGWTLIATKLANGNWLVSEYSKPKNGRLTGFISKLGESKYTLDK